MDTISRKKLEAPFLWADSISVVREGENLFVHGDWDLNLHLKGKLRDLYDAYHHDKTGPHIVFANCQSDDDLIVFVQRFGPVVSIEVDFDSFEHPSAVQNLRELRNERDLFRAALDLVRALSEATKISSSGISGRIGGRSKTFHSDDEVESERIGKVSNLVNVIAEGTKAWGAQFLREQKRLDRVYSGVIPEWHWDDRKQKEMMRQAENARRHSERMRHRKPVPSPLVRTDARRSGREAVCLLMNAFPLTLRWHGNYVAECPSRNLIFGIRPLLFAMLRWDLLADREIRQCVRLGCGNFFLALRSDKKSCSEYCSGLEATKRYYASKRKPARQKASKARRAKTQRTRISTRKG